MMNKENEYYVLDAADIHMVDNPSVVETRETVRWNKDKTKFICKTKVGLVDDEFFISKRERKNKRKEIKNKLKENEWINEEVNTNEESTSTSTGTGEGKVKTDPPVNPQ